MVSVLIRKLRWKFVLIAAVSILLVELIIISAINIINYVEVEKQNDEVMQMLTDNNGTFPDHKPEDDPGFNKQQPGDMHQEKPEDNGSLFGKKSFNEETVYKTRYFSVTLDSNNNVTKVDTGHIAAVTSEGAGQLAKEVADEEEGYSGVYKFRVVDKGDEKLVIFLDRRTELETNRTFLLISILIGVSGFAIALLLIVILSKKAIKPVIENMEKQKQFITDAGHELKTPLAIISANTEVLELTVEENEWTQSIKNQVNRLGGLIKDMLTMARAEGAVENMTPTEFDISKAVRETAEPFETLAMTNSKTIRLDIDEGLRYYGDEGAIKQLTSVLAENAVKYGDEGGEISMTLKPEGRGVRLSVKNPCSDPPKDPDRLFDRFYRGDSSHARADGDKKGGYGIGLSVAAAIVEAHKGRISCHVRNGYVSFNAHLGKLGRSKGK